MTTPSRRYATGALCGARIDTPDPEATRAFYRDVLDWTAEALPAAEGRGGAGARWLTYFAVDDIDGVIQRAQEGGARVLPGLEEVWEGDRLAYLSDPTGATLCLRQIGGTSSGAETVGDAPVSLCKHDLYTDDTVQAAAFYTRLFGYASTTTDMGDFAYTTLQTRDPVDAVICPLLPEFSAVAYWQPFFLVADADETVRKARALGGTILWPPTVHDHQRFAHIRDPQGAVFGILESAPIASATV